MGNSIGKLFRMGRFYNKDFNYIVYFLPFHLIIPSLGDGFFFENTSLHAHFLDDKNVEIAYIYVYPISRLLFQKMDQLRLCFQISHSFPHFIMLFFKTLSSRIQLLWTLHIKGGKILSNNRSKKMKIF